MRIDEQVFDWRKNLRPMVVLVLLLLNIVVLAFLSCSKAQAGGPAVTVTEFSDFQCPYCQQAAGVAEQLRQIYGDNVNFVFKQMPLPMHPYAFKAAEAAVIAQQQGKFWEYHDRLFAATDLSVDALKAMAAEIGLKPDEFSEALDSDASRAAVEKDIQDAKQLGVRGTPAFFVNGKQIRGAATLARLTGTIDSALTRPGGEASETAVESENSNCQDSTRAAQASLIKVAFTQETQAAATTTTTASGLIISPASINFGYQLVGTAGPQIVETVTNSGNAPLTITGISVSGRDQGDFMPTYGFVLPVTVAPGGSIAINVAFTPAVPWKKGTRNASLKIAAKKGSSQYVPLTGIGTNCLGPLPACSSGCPDSDGDGLNDAWEIAGGVDFNNDGVIDATHDLRLAGADPNRPNIYVKYDYFVEAGSGTPCTANANCIIAGEVCDTGSATCVKHTHAPSAAALNTVRTAFSNHGVILTYFNDPIVGGTPDALTEHIDPLLNHTDSIVSFETGAQLAASPECAGPGGVSFYDIKAAHLPARLAPVYHYAVFSHYSICDESEYVGVSCIDDTDCQAINPGWTCDNLRCSGASHCSACLTIKGTSPQWGNSGVAENDNFEGGNDLIVSLGGLVDQGFPVTDTLAAGAFMHELGHNLGLTHGGGSGPGNSEKYKPNYLSVMDYNYNLTGIGMTSAPGPFATSTIDPSVTRRIDYSEQALPSLIESNLDENVGTGGPPTSTDVAVFYANFGTCKVYAPSNGSPVDWDIAPPVNDMGQCLPYTEPPPYSDIGISADISANGTLSTLTGHSDWDVLLYKFQCLTDGLDGPSAGSVANASPLQAREPALQDGELTFHEAFARHIIYPQRKVAISILDDSSRPNRSVITSLYHTVAVILLGSDDLNVKEVESSSLRFGGAPPMQIEMQDINGDGKPDLVLTFNQAILKLNLRTNSAFLTGWLKNSQEIVAEGTVNIVD